MSKKSIETVLLIEDNAGDARLIREMFNEQGLNSPDFTHVECMRDAENHLAGHAVDIILLDLGLPDAQGLDSVRQAHAAAPRVPLVVLSCSDDESMAVQALQEGAQDYLIKGQIAPRELLRALRYAVERKIIEQQLQQAQKMETVGQLTGGIAHDFNNLLGVILGYCEILEERLDLSEPIRKMIVEIHNAGTSGKDLTRHLLAFSRRQMLQPVLLDLNATVNRLYTMLKRLIGDEVELVSILGSDLGTIMADPIQLEQVLMNLAINARDAMPHGGRITIGTANAEVDETSVRHNPAAKLGPYVMLAVSDTGVGMDEETQSRIFEPFFSTKEIGKGTGLGLSTVFGIVKQSAGTITVSSKPGYGTTFRIYFPRCAEAPSVTRPAKAVPLRGGSETLLLVDDTDALRELTRQLLEDCGYTVLDSGDPVQAIQIAEQYKGPLPLMITDVMMPGFSGPVLADKLAATRPETRVLYTSGCADRTVFKHAMFGSDHAFLEKPFTRDDLVRKVRELLDSPVRRSG
jgi:signal transduction histidine kinase